MLATTVNFLAHLVSAPLFLWGGDVTSVAEPAYIIASALVIGITFPFLYRIFNVHIRQVLTELPAKTILSLCAAPAMFYIVGNIYVITLGAFSNTLISFIIVFSGLFSAYINLRMVLDAAKYVHTEKELGEKNAMLDSLSRMKSEYLANISHEMKTPLTVMSGYAQQTREEIESGRVNEETVKNLRIIQSEAHRLAELADSVLYSSKNLQTGIVISPVNPAEILKRAAAICEPILAKNNNRLEYTLENAFEYSDDSDDFGDSGCFYAAANLDMIVSVILNLCANANRHTKNGVVSVTIKTIKTVKTAEQTKQAEQAGGFIEFVELIEFTVKDNGGGIPPELLSHVFERGISGDDMTGYGLAICWDVIRQHGGTIHIESQYGKGCCIVFTLPAVPIVPAVPAVLI
jgi:signal transduction histidine kinase